MSVAGSEGEKHESTFTKRTGAPDRIELHGLLRRIAAGLPSHELRIAHLILHSIRVALAGPQYRPGS